MNENRGDVSSDPMGVFVPDLDEPATAYQPGDVAIATVRVGDASYPNELVYRFLSGWAAIELGYHDLTDDEVTVTSRAVVVTEADRDQLVEDLTEYLGDVGHEDTVSRWYDALLGGGQ